MWALPTASRTLSTLHLPHSQLFRCPQFAASARLWGQGDQGVTEQVSAGRPGFWGQCHHLPARPELQQYHAKRGEKLDIRDQPYLCWGLWKHSGGEWCLHHCYQRVGVGLWSYLSSCETLDKSLSLSGPLVSSSM